MGFFSLSKLRAGGTFERCEIMNGNPRPTCISVIGWFWIIVGGLMFLSGTIGFVAFLLTLCPAQNENILRHSVSPLLWVVPVVAILQLVVAILAVVSGIHFLKLRHWARRALEVLTWAFLILVVGFGVCWVFMWTTTSSARFGITIVGTVMGALITIAYGTPLVIVLRFLRGQKVLSAMVVGHSHIGTDPPPARPTRQEPRQ